MTHDEIMALDADGLRLEVAKIKGLAYPYKNDVTGEPWVLDWQAPQWSTDIRAAWELVEEMPYNWTFFRDMGKCGDEYETKGDKIYHFVLAAPGMPMAGMEDETAPLAICRAYLMWKQT